MQEPQIQNILSLSDYTVDRPQITKYGCWQNVLGTEKFSRKLSEGQVLLKLVRNRK